jgi:hypothetical protein
MDEPNAILDDELNNLNEAIHEYYKLKEFYDMQINKQKSKIIRNELLSKKEKKREFMEFAPKCVSCKRPGGTIFQSKYISNEENGSGYRKLKAICGIVSDPCNLNIEINVGKTDLLPDLLQITHKDIQSIKNEIIDDKNKLLFGYINEEQIVQNFDDLKDNVNSLSSIYEHFLKKYTDITENEDKKQTLDTYLKDEYEYIQLIKDCIQKLNETNNSKFASDAVEIYKLKLVPLLEQIRKSKFDEMFVKFDADVCKLVQIPHNIKSLSDSDKSNIVNFIVSPGNKYAATKETKNAPLPKANKDLDKDIDKDDNKDIDKNNIENMVETKPMIRKKIVIEESSSQSGGNIMDENDTVMNADTGDNVTENDDSNEAYENDDDADFDYYDDE